VTAAARASTCAYNIVASKFVMNYWVDNSKEGSPRSCSIIAAILEPTRNTLRFEPSNFNEITSYLFLMKCFEDVNCLGFCQRVQDVGYHENLIGIFSLTLREDKITIVGTDFMFSLDSISQATCIPNHGENCFKGMNLELEEYKPYLKSQFKGAHSHVFPFIYLLKRYAPLMKVFMKFFTCEGIFSRIYQYHIRLLMHFTTVKSLNLSNYLYRSLTKNSERVQLKGKGNYPSLFHHSLIKVIVLHQLT